MIVGLTATAVLFLLVLWQVQTGGALVTLDGVMNAGLLAVRSRTSLAASAWISQMGTGAAGAIIALTSTGLLLSDGRARLILPLWIAFLGAEATTWPLKFITARARPTFLEGITAGSPSFPSAHATVAVAIYGFLAVVVAAGLPGSRIAIYAAASALILLICFSRMLLSLHYFSDVMAGAAVGLFWVLLACRVAAL